MTGPAPSAADDQHVLPCRCPSCGKDVPVGRSAACSCGTSLETLEGFVRYDWRRLLFLNHRRKYLLNQALNNNGALSYLILRSGSLSLADRPDVARFRDYLLERAEPGRLLDVGCGVLGVPGYLQDESGAALPFLLHGVDPMPPETPFPGTRVVGCSEYLPFHDASFDTLVFATSLDHVCDMRRTLRESYRVLRPGGSLVIWMGDAKGSRLELLVQGLDWRLRDIARALTGRPRRVDCVVRVGPYVVYPDLTVMAVPAGGVDPYHSYHESPERLSRWITRAGFRLDDVSRLSRTEVFLSFRKPAS